MSSASPAAGKPEKEKSKKSVFSLKRKKKKDKHPKKASHYSSSASVEIETSSVYSETTDSAVTEIHITRPVQRMAESEAQVADLSQRLEEEQRRVDELEQKLLESESDARKWREKVSEFEKMGTELDDESFATAQEFQLKKQVDELKANEDKHRDMAEELEKTKEELHDARLLIEELQFHQERDTTRTKMRTMRDDKSARDEVVRLQREIRQLETKFNNETSLLQAQLKASEDSLQRAQEKTLAIRHQLDDVDKEKLQLKIENKRLLRKLDKEGSYSQRKRIETEKETQQLEIQNLRRQKAKLERQLSSPGVSIVEPLSPGSASRSSSRMSDINENSISGEIASDMTVSEMRLKTLEKEVNKLEAQTYNLGKENEKLKEDLASAAASKEGLVTQVEHLQKTLSDQKKESELLEDEVKNLRARASAGSSEDYVEQLQAKIESLEKKLDNKETEFRVKEREMRATNEELKRSVEELEMAKLRAELGEDEEEGEDAFSDTEDQNAHALRERLNSISSELESVKASNNLLKDAMDKQKKENDELLKIIEVEIDAAESQSPPPEDGLKKKNEELSRKLKDQTEKYTEAVREVARLRKAVDEQEDKIAVLQLRGSKNAPVSNGRVSEKEEKAPKKVKPIGGVQMMIGGKKKKKAAVPLPTATS